MCWYKASELDLVTLKCAAIYRQFCFQCYVVPRNICCQRAWSKRFSLLKCCWDLVNVLLEFGIILKRVQEVGISKLGVSVVVCLYGLFLHCRCGVFLVVLQMLDFSQLNYWMNLCHSLQLFMSELFGKKTPNEESYRNLLIWLISALVYPSTS